MITVNGKEYPLWSQFVEQKERWIGGTLEDSGDNTDRAVGVPPMSTVITSITLKPNGNESAFFSVNGVTFNCGFDVGYGGITSGESGWITFSGYAGHRWRIKEAAHAPE